jgi:hypothetical protein
MNLEKVIEHVGGCTRLARRLGCTAHQVHEWRRMGSVPETRRRHIILAVRELISDMEQSISDSGVSK